MNKLSKQDKIEIYKRRMLRERVSRLSLAFGVNESTIKYLVRLISFHGLQILDKKGNKRYPKALKMQIINEVMIEGKSTHAAAIEYALPGRGVLTGWIRQYQKNNSGVVPKRRGRKPMKKATKLFQDMTDAEKLSYLEKENYRLRAENEFLKKAQALIQKKKQQALKN